MCSFQFNLLSSVTPRYLAVFPISIVVSFTLILFGALIFLFLVQKITCVLTVLISSPLDLHHDMIFFKYLMAVSIIVSLSDPVCKIRRSSAYARRFSSPSNEFSRSFTTRFHRKGDNTPP